MILDWIGALRYVYGESSGPQRYVLSMTSITKASVMLKSVEVSRYQHGYLSIYRRYGLL
jgi:hypothetical protein